ncbi:MULTISPECIES: EF-hand domain-containing protein [Meridianimarinicoccus]|uniref:EF-hand domain-containing protein n=1 Tax=Meridianimarinicoccus zhengii TaxID=2056810 RepID=UPI000DAC1948|nr:EF-hand domain-containing protein [Phycocomes zhengii]
MRRMTVGALAAALFAAPALALMVSDVDSDGDGMISFTEMAEAYPGLTEDTFATVDTSGDGMVDEAELAAALEAGVIKEPAE